MRCFYAFKQNLACPSPEEKNQVIVVPKQVDLGLKPVFNLKLTMTTNNSVTFSSSSYINVLYPFINLTILHFLHSIEIAFYLFSFFFPFLFIRAFVLQFSC